MTSAAYYNENEPYAAQWLRNLVAAGHIAAGDVDRRSILDVRADDLRGYTQCHFFAGIGGWSLALRLAGWPDDRPVWTGSCPCQPFSNAGKQRGSDDERHLWPAWFRLISECRLVAIFGEQVAGAAGLAWLDHVCADLEGAGYAAAAADLPACSVGAPHIRQRLWWVAYADGMRSTRIYWEGKSGTSERGFMGDASLTRLAQQRSKPGAPRETQPGGARQATERADASTPWSDLEWLACTDGKARPTKPGLFPLAHGVPARVGKLRAAGNAIVPQAGAAFIATVMECTP